MKNILPLLMSLLLFACAEPNVADLDTFVVETKAKTYPLTDAIPTLKKIDTLSFTKSKARSPFSLPASEIIVVAKDAPKSCPQPNFNRPKQPLEAFALESMQMRGTLLINGHLWALVQVAGSEVHKVSPGTHLGLNYGEVLKIDSNKIDLLELAPDSNGCWKERVTQIQLVSAES